MMTGSPILTDEQFNGAASQTTSVRGGAIVAPDQMPHTSTIGSATIASSGTVGAGRVMTIGGTVSATFLMLMALIAGAWFGWQRVVETVTRDRLGQVQVNADLPAAWMFGSILLGFVLVIATSVKPTLSPYLAIPYAIAEGVFVGIISHVYDARFSGIVMQAVLATAGVFVAMLLLHNNGVLRATPKFTKVVITATMGIAAMYLVGFVASLFGADLRFWSSPSPLGILVSVGIVVIAALNLIIDFDVIERGVAACAPSYMNWFGAIGVVVTLVWLYLEVLRLIAKLDSR